MVSRSSTRLRLWHLSAVVAVSALSFGVARIPGILPFLGFATFGVTPAIGIASLWNRHLKRPKPTDFDAFAEFCVFFFGIFIPMGIYWIVLGGVILSLTYGFD